MNPSKPLAEKLVIGTNNLNAINGVGTDGTIFNSNYKYKFFNVEDVISAVEECENDLDENLPLKYHLIVNAIFEKHFGFEKEIK